MNVSKHFFHMPPMLFAIIIGCETISYSSGLSSTRYLVNEPEMTVGMEVTYRDGSPEYSHPAAINPELLDQVLHHIEVQPSSLLERIAGGSATIQQAFSAEQRSVLCNALSKALNLATSLETVTFYWATPRGNGLWEITSGGLYLQEDDLHMLLTNYRQTVPAKNPPQNPRKHPLSPLGESLHSLRAIDPLRQLSHSLATELWSPQTPHFIFPLKTWSTGQNPSHSPEVSASHTSGGSRESIKQRLKNLEDLRKEGLLTEKEYQQKRQEIFEEL